MEVPAARGGGGGGGVHNEQVMSRRVRSSRYRHRWHELTWWLWAVPARWRLRWRNRFVAERKNKKVKNDPLQKMSQGLKKTTQKWLERSQRSPGAGLWPRIQQNPQWEARRPHHGWAKLAVQQENTSSSSPDGREVTPSGKPDCGREIIWSVTENCGVWGAADNVLMF